MCFNVFNVWPKTSLLPVWRRDTKRLDTPAARPKGTVSSIVTNIHIWPFAFKLIKIKLH